MGNHSMVTWVGPLATIHRELGQAWKGAAVAVDLCAGVWLVQVATLNFQIFFAFDVHCDSEIMSF